MSIGNGRLAPILTKEGGIAIPFINKTGAPSVKGTLVIASSTTDSGVEICPADNPDIIGIIYQDGILDGDDVLVVISGKAEVLLQDLTSATRGYWVRISVTQNGRADITNASPPGGGIPQADIHFRELGHCIESKASGTDVLTNIVLHFN